MTYYPGYPALGASDGSGTVYAVEGDKIWVSHNSGLSWQAVGSPDFKGASYIQLIMAQPDAQALYAFLPTSEDNGQNSSYKLYYSTDAGNTWEKRSSDSFKNVSIISLHGLSPNSDSHVLILSATNSFAGEPNPNSKSTDYVSMDGGVTFKDIDGSTNSHTIQMLQTSQGIERFSLSKTGKSELAITKDAGQSWQQLPALPFTQPNPAQFYLSQSSAAPDNLFLRQADGKGILWYSADAGQHWQQLGENKSAVFISPFLPLRLLGYDINNSGDNHDLYVLDVEEASKSVTVGVEPNGTAGNTYFEATRHNMPAVFHAYWEQHGGLAQFGYPKTEPFLEVNSADHKVYLVQYFERNRFEYHPDLGGTPYEVELGLLGNQMTQNRHDNGEVPFQKVTNPGESAGQIYFDQTSHALTGKFLDYWQTHGGLAIYGYPISEPFQEINPDDGKTYLVQYFERNRFELHSELAGTPYEVELGLLGNTLLKQKGWLK
jgi:hypothetical protein